MKTLLVLLLLVPSLSWGSDKDELKEQLKYWKSLLDDELISQEDYDLKKNELCKNIILKKIFLLNQQNLFPALIHWFLLI